MLFYRNAKIALVWAEKKAFNRGEEMIVVGTESRRGEGDV